MLGYNLAMVTVNAHFDGRAIVLDEGLVLPPGTRLRVTVQAVTEPSGSLSPASLDLPVLTGASPELVQSAMADTESAFDTENIEPLLRPQRT